MAKVAPCKSQAGKWWSTKRCILACLAGIVAGAAVVSVAFVVFRPGQIRFSITRHASNATDDDVFIELNLTLAANNTSHRTGVRYRSVLVYLQYASATEPENYYITQANVTSATPRQPPLNTTDVEVSALLLKADFGKPATSGGGRNNAATMISVLVVTEVLFTVGPACSRPYQVRVVCDPVDYFISGSLNAATPINCK